MKRKAFTLIEMAIVLVILGLIIGIGTGVMVQYIKWNKRQQTERKVDSQLNDIIGIAVSKGKIDLSDIENSTFTDAYSQKIITVLAYKLTSNFFDSTNNTNATICDIKDTQVRLNDTAKGIEIDNIAFVVFSKGSDYTSNTYCDRTQINSTQTCNSIIRTDSTKDIIRYVTLPELKQYLGCVGNPLHILNNELPPAFVGENYNVTLYADGGLKPYTWQITNSTCPWLSNNILTNDKKGMYQLSNKTEIPSEPRNCFVTVSVSDSNSPSPYTTQKKFVITVKSKQNGSTGGNETGCTEYDLNVHVKYSVLPIGVEVNKDCYPATKKFSKSGLSPTTEIKIYNTYFPILGCEGLILLSGSAKDLDTNKNCKVNIHCDMLTWSCTYN